jgi:hypothetical protein
MVLALGSWLIRHNSWASIALISLRPFYKLTARVVCVRPGIGELSETGLIKIHLLNCPLFQWLRRRPLHFTDNFRFLLNGSSSLTPENPRLDRLMAVRFEE